MLRIETKGSPRQMGQQLGEAFREWFPQLFNHFAKWLLADLNRFRPVIREIDALLLCHAPSYTRKPWAWRKPLASSLI